VGFIQASPCLYKGATLIIHRRFNAVEAYQDIEGFDVTKFLGVPTVFRALLEVEPERRGDLSSLTVCAIGGEKVTPELLSECRQNGFPLRQVMGQTETSILLWASEEESLQRPGTVGRPVFHAEVTLVDRQGRRVGPNQVGEIVVRGSIMMKEYWQDPGQTEQILGGGWLRTGDLARMDEDGYFYLVDRAKDRYISGGENVYPSELEGVLRFHEAVKDVAVIGVPDEKWGEALKALVVLNEGYKAGDTLAQGIIDFARGKIAGYKRPKTIDFIREEEMPRTPTGTILHRVLRSRYGDASHA
jgi:fatty-acyl-CoA synthase